MSRSLMSEITDIFKKRPWKNNGKSIKRFLRDAVCITN